MGRKALRMFYRSANVNDRSAGRGQCRKIYRPCHRTPPTGFTLLELLWVIAVIVVLATMMLGALRGAQEDAKESATLALMSQVEALLYHRHQAYEVRKIGIELDDVDGILRRQIRQMIVADIIQIEMPRSSSDLAAFPSQQLRSGLQRLVDQNLLTIAARERIITELASERPAVADHFLPGFNNGEYLYGIVATSELNEFPATDLIARSSIDDVDGNGYYELVDAWGDPLVLVIQQQAARESEPLVWQDLFLDPTGAVTTDESPRVSFQDLDPSIPRAVSQIRFAVRSANVNTPPARYRGRPFRRY